MKDTEISDQTLSSLWDVNECNWHDMYSLNVSNCNNPIFCIYLYLYPEKCSAPPPPPISEGVGDYVLYLYSFYFRVGEFNGCL